MNVLVAEDDITTNTILTSLLEKWGYEVITAYDGRKAWEIIQGNDAPRLIILDWEMPEMKGIEICSLVRHHETTDPQYIIMLTSKYEKSDIVRGLESGANDYIVKPFDNAELLARIRVGHNILDMQYNLNRSREELAYQATHDPLTGIFNRKAIMEILQKELTRAEREKSNMCVCVCDIDYFKQINDSYGHKFGDTVLCGIVEALRSELRDYDSIGRIGGEEFLVIMPTCKSKMNKTVCERLRTSVENTSISSPVNDISVTISIGATLNINNDSVDKVIERADKFLYDAKRAGRNRVVFDPR